MKYVRVLSINPVDMAGKVASDAKDFDLPFDVLVGRDGDIITDYQITKVPRVIVVAKGGTIVLSEKFASYEMLKEVILKTRDKK
jgi:hypothetical protein